MHRSILSASIGALIAPIIIGYPRLAFGEGEVQDKPDVQLGLDDKVAGEEPPDFSEFDKKYGDEPAQPEAKPAAETPKPQETPKPEESAKPKTPPKEDPNDLLEVPAVKPQETKKETQEKEVPDPKDDVKRAADEKAAAKKEADEQKAAADKEKAEKEAGEEEKLPTEEEIDAMQPKPGAPTRIVKSFEEIKKPLKAAVQRVKQLETELATLKQGGNTGSLDEATQKELEELRGLRQMIELENDPEISREYNDKLKSTEDAFFDMLVKDPRLKMNPETAKKIREAGLDGPNGVEEINKILTAVQKTGNVLLYEEVRQAALARLNVTKEHQQRIQQLRTNREQFIAQKAEVEKKKVGEWASKADETLLKLVDNVEWANYKDVPENATKEQKAEVEAHNKFVKETLVPAFQADMRAIWNRDPQKGIELVFKAHAAQQLEKQIAAKDAELAKAQERIKQLEGDAGRIKRVSTPSKMEAAPAAKVEATPVAGGSADDAIDSFLAERGIK